ncbi:Uma2 family endonuclease [Sorangium sp. So ce1078]|uniref:Uma2 family endonuclease n=1 Tax=Sorangium sp. So ce1078 TaxID=3133329 RepID=UPI003F60B514
MGQPAEKPRRATYADLEAAPPNKVAELIRGVLHVFPRPAPRHARAASSLGVKICGPFDHGTGGPGGWWILDEPEIHFPDPDSPGDVEAVVPDIAGWRRERMPELPETPYFSLAPDWICEVLSPSTEQHDRKEKMPLYAREGVQHAWLVDPLQRTLEVFSLTPGRGWTSIATHRDAARVRAAPFQAIELELAVLWAT